MFQSLSGWWRAGTAALLAAGLGCVMAGKGGRPFPGPSPQEVMFAEWALLEEDGAAAGPALGPEEGLAGVAAGLAVGALKSSRPARPAIPAPPPWARAPDLNLWPAAPPANGGSWPLPLGPPGGQDHHRDRKLPEARRDGRPLFATAAGVWLHRRTGWRES